MVRGDAKVKKQGIERIIDELREETHKKANLIHTYEIEDAAYHFAEDIVKKMKEKDAEFIGRPKSEWIFKGVAINQHPNKMGVFEDDKGIKHLSIAGGKHRVAFHFESEYEKTLFMLRIAQALGFKVTKKGKTKGWNVYLGKKGFPKEKS